MVKKTAVAAAKAPRTVKALLSEGTTWAGLLTIAAAVATGGASVFTDPLILSEVGAGIALIFAREGG